MVNTSVLINELLYYFKINFNLNDSNDLLYLRNIILSELYLNTYIDNEINEDRKKEIKNYTNPDYFTNKLEEYFKSINLIEKEIELRIARIFGLLTPLPSVITNNFYSIYKQKCDKEALDYFYDLSIKNDYIKITHINKNIKWIANFDNKYLEITINLSKPEKKPSDIAKLLNINKTDISYPKCSLCKENLGYYGRNDFAARSNIRLIPIQLSNNKWYLQYSPYGYFDMHCIVLKDNHSNMVINKEAFSNLLEFLDMFPSFFIGSNADLPIVGGSILNHDHYQGGRHLLPIMNASIKNEYKINLKYNTTLYHLDWYNTALLVKGTNKEEVINVGTKILEKWRNYSDLNNDIISKSNNELHNTITPSARKINDTYYLYLILRNNNCNEEYKEGIFHAHKQYHHIKQENIGIIEAMGLFILPPRLLRQINQLKDCVLNNYNNEQIIQKYPDFNNSFLDAIKELKLNSNKDNIDENIKNYINNVCKNILINTAVFKDTKVGQEGLNKFIKEVFIK